jgi:DNA invertase Pin-like site-specific DNA recombinase
MKTAVIYARCSTEEQAEKNLSIPAQLEECHKWAKTHDYQVTGEYIDAGFSGTTTKRPDFARMFRDIEHNLIKVNAVIVWSFSRFSRDSFDSITYKKKLEKEKINVVSITEPIPEESAFSGLIERVLEAINQLQVDITREDTIRGMKYNLRQGFWNGGVPPLGYQTKKVEVSGKTRSIIEVDPIEAEWVKYIFKRFAQGVKYSILIEELHQMGAKPRRGQCFTKTSFYSILTNPLYVGKMAWNKRPSNSSHFKPKEEWEFTTAQMPGIIDQNTFDICSSILQERRKTYQRNLNYSYWLSGILTCKHCDGAYYGNFYKARGYGYYRSGKCPQCKRTHRSDTIEKVIEKVVVDILTSNDIARRIRKEIEMSNKTVKKDQVNLELALKEVNRRLNNLRIAIETSGIISETLNNGVIELEKQKQALLESAEEAKLRNMKIVSIENIRKEFIQIKEEFLKASPEEKRSIVKVFIEKVYVNEKNDIEVKLTFKNCVVQLAEGACILLKYTDILRKAG